MPLTAWWPVGTMLLVLGLLVALAAIRAVTPRLPRVLLGLLSVVAVLASAGVGVNAYYGYFRTLGEALGAAAARTRRTLAGPGGRRPRPGAGHGRAHRPCRRHGLGLRGAPGAGVPPAGLVDAPAGPRSPWSCCCTGPRAPRRTGWTPGARPRPPPTPMRTQHDGVAPILVMPDVNGLDRRRQRVRRRPPGGKVETYLTVDVPAFVEQVFRTRSPPGRGWAVAGLSEGGPAR